MSRDLFSDTETVIGYVSSNTGSLMITDGVWASELPSTSDKRILIDTENQENSAYKIITVRKNNRRYIIIPLDDRIAQEEPNDFVQVEKA